MAEQLKAAFALLPSLLGQHLLLSLSALVLGLVLSLPLAVWAARDARVRWPVLALASLIQTIPGLALLAGHADPDVAALMATPRVQAERVAELMRGGPGD